VIIMSNQNTIQKPRCFMSGMLLISTGIIILAAICSGCAAIINTSNSKLTSADDKGILYTGRVDRTNPKAVRFDWPGILISANFEGPYIGARLNDGNNDYNIFIDGFQTGVLVTRPAIKDYTLASGLSAGPHLLVLSRRGEGYQGVATFEGFLLDKGAKILKQPAPPSRRIEFIGDSISVGFGVEGPGITCPSEREFKNNWKAYSAVASRELNAEYHIIAISGKGLVKNWAEKTTVSPEPMPFFYDRTIQNDADLKWDFKSWMPDAVVINLGTNDYSAPPVPAGDIFTAAYVKLINTVRKEYPNAKIFCCLGPAQQPPFNRYFVDTLDKFEGKGVYRVDLAGLADTELGCDWHPNEAASKRLGQELAEQMKPVLGW
jgi:lysophospholipase L1-like esterase